MVVRYALLLVLLILSASRALAQKCGTQAEIERHFLLREQPQAVQARLSMTDSLVSASGLFMIHFTTIGDSACTNEYAQTVASFADEAYRFEVLELGYPKPAFSYDDSLWHIYIVNMPGTVYGYTSPIVSGYLGDSPSGVQRYRSFIVIDNNYIGYPTPGNDGARITIYHEFHHIIQFAVYGIRNEDGNLREMTSVWMEMRAVPDVKDYLFILPRMLETLDLSMPNVGGSGYAQGVWLQFLQIRYGDDFIKKLWESYRNKIANTLRSFEDVCMQHNTTFCSEYKSFGAEIFFTGRRYRGKSIFPDARMFPADLIPYHRQEFGSTVTYDNILPASLQFVASGDMRDTSVVVIARTTDASFVSSDTVQIIDFRTYRAGYQFPETFCDTIVKIEPTTAEAFPMPFLIGTGETDMFKALAGDRKPVSKVRFTVFTSGMKLVRYIEADPQPMAGRWFVEWDGRDDTGRLSASGIYIYTIEVDGERRAGKVSVIRK